AWRRSSSPARRRRRSSTGSRATSGPAWRRAYEPASGCRNGATSRTGPNGPARRRARPERAGGTRMTPLIFTAVLPAAAAQAQAQAVEKALVAAEPALHRCWEKAAADDFRVQGQIAVSVTVGPTGKAARVAIKADSIGKRELEECVGRAFDGVDF